MNPFFLRFVPWGAALVALVSVRSQWAFPLGYPVPLVVTLVAFLVAAVLIAWRRLPWTELTRTLLPSIIAFLAASLSFLLAEGEIERVLISVVYIFLPWVVLELLFLSLHEPSRYPVNGLSRVNIALLPLSAFYLASALNGLLVFVRLPWVWVFLGCMGLGMGMLFATEHPTATMKHRLRWLGLGEILGFQLAILVLLLPVDLFVHGALASLLLAIPLRWRRFAYQPLPTSRQAMMETCLFTIGFVSLLTVARWV